ncbi:MAG: arsenate reductase [Acidithiobacillales bacterium SG8_45]|jgi:arsenate reductase|nr:MAG: arsenate reductase [Acidithiobacillales bacterium SG8_45]
MPKVTIYHNPRCSKSRQTLALIQEKGIEPEVIEYLKNPPSAAELERILGLLDLSPRELLRKKEAEYQEAGLDADNLDDSAVIDAMVAHPKLIERPIVVVDGKAAVGRPPENVEKIL